MAKDSKKLIGRAVNAGFLASSSSVLWKAIAVGLLLLVFGLFKFSPPVAAQTSSDVRLTRHNLSSSGTGSTKATSETQVCVFCHTPHNATTTVAAPLWNRAVNTGADFYTRYKSSSLDAENVVDAISAQPGGSSTLCLSCHDGTVALGNVNVLPKNTGTPAGGPIAGLAGTMPTGLGVNTGYTRNLGTNLTNDHPISFTYNDAVAGLDGELAHMNGSQQNTNPTTPISAVGALIGIRSSGYKPLLPLERTGADLGGGVKAGQMQCGTCHDPHLYDATDPNRKFLRLNRLSKESPVDDTFRPALDNICMACHKKSYSSWGMSAHAKSTVADETYTDLAADLRGFKRGTKVFEASCLNCHDTHTVQGSRRLLREGVAGTNVGGTGTTAVYQLGSDPLLPAENNTKSGIETTCFQCHRARDSMNILNTAAGSMVPAVKSLFDLPYGMPVATDTQANGSREVHDVTNGNMREDPVNLGYGNNANRHAECSDCHNPHRVRRSRTFYSTADADNSNRTHIPGGVDGNMASGVLRGTWGVEPVFGFSASSWPTFPTFPPTAIKEGDPGVVTRPVGSDGTRAVGHVTREYQLCFKCHSNYTNGETKASFAPLVADYAPFTTSRRTPTSAANGLTRYTNVAAEFGSVIAEDPPKTDTDQGEFTDGTNNKGSACNGTDCAPRTAVARVGTSTITSKNEVNNHRSWHPVVYPTGRDRVERRMSTSGRINLLPPFKASIGVQTMHCSDCHGQARSWIPGQDAAAESGGADPNEVQGPHGSENPFLLRGIWTEAVNLSNIRSSSSQFTTNRPLCGNCHQPRDGSSGYNSQHVATDSSGMSNIRCMGCHIAVPHGWRNKAFLVNLRCVGTEVGRTSTAGGWSTAEKTTPTDCDDWGDYSTKLDEEPYYYRSVLRVTTWQRSGNWTKTSCGGGNMSDGTCN